jgi:hypothetical protein
LTVLSDSLLFPLLLDLLLLLVVMFLSGLLQSLGPPVSEQAAVIFGAGKLLFAALRRSLGVSSLSFTVFTVFTVTRRASLLSARTLPGCSRIHGLHELAARSLGGLLGRNLIRRKSIGSGCLRN